MPSENRPYVGRGLPDATPMKDETVFDLDRQEHGIVTRRLNNGGGTVFVRFPGSDDEVMYTYRAALNVWKAFPGSPFAQGLQPLE